MLVRCCVLHKNLVTRLGKKKEKEDLLLRREETLENATIILLRRFISSQMRIRCTKRDFLTTENPLRDYRLLSLGDCIRS